MKKLRSLGTQQNISLRLPKGKVRGLVTQSKHQDLEPQELAKKIVSDWLKKKGY
jgi:hypothetical protein